MRSFVGAYKVLSRVIPQRSSHLAPLDSVTAGRQSQENIPTLYVTRNNKLLLSGFFSAKLCGAQSTWLPCEIEALSIAAATKHFSPSIIQSGKKVSVLTDSKPCVQGFEKLCSGEFSASPRLSTFLSVVSLPLLSTFVSVVLHGRVRLPFTSHPAWLSIQTECPDMRRTHAHLTQGTRPSKKLNNIKDVKRYLNIATIASDGLLVVKRNEPPWPNTRLHHCSLTSHRWSTRRPPHPTTPSYQPPTKNGCKTLPLRT